MKARPSSINGIGPFRAIALLVVAVSPALAQDRALAYRGATIETIAKDGRIDGGTIVLRDGEIEAVGKDADVKIPDDAKIIDAKGKTILPGLVEPNFELATPGAVPEGRIVRVGGRTIRVGGGGPTRTPTFTKMVDVFYPYDARLEPFLRSGLTHLNLMQRGYGQSAIVKILPDDPEKLVIQPDGRLFLSVTNATATLDLLRNGLKSGKPTPPAAAKPEEAQAGRPAGGTPGRGDGPSPRPGGGRDSAGPPAPGTRPGGPPSPAHPLWQAVVEGKAPLMIEANNAAAILYTLDALKEYKDVQLSLIVAGPDVLRAVEPLKSRPLTLVIRPAIELVPNSRNRQNVARFAHENGLKFAFTFVADRATLSAGQDVPLFPLGYLVRTGLPRSAALEAATLAPARLLGQDKVIGSLEAGKAATLLVFDGDPFSPASRLRQVLIDGRTVHEN